MGEVKPSFTAEIGALIRSIETEKPENIRLCYDPYAEAFVGKTLTAIGMIAPLKRLGLWYLENKHPKLIDCTPARTRYIDAHVNRCIDSGIEQLIILGAGYDSRAYRMKRLKEKVTVFEVDLPAIQKLKKEKLKKIIDLLPYNVVYVPIDFNKEKLSEKLLEYEYDKDKKSLFIWEGVTPYLTAEAVDKTLHYVAKNSIPGSSIIFSYILKSVVDGTCQLENAALIRKVFNTGGIFDFNHKRGEALLFGIEEGKIESFMSERGFHEINDISGDYYDSEYFTGENRNRKGCCMCRIVTAQVKPSE
jgi:methyltransferase (TIGR00027 family)